MSMMFVSTIRIVTVPIDNPYMAYMRALNLPLSV